MCRELFYVLNIKYFGNMLSNSSSFNAFLLWDLWVTLTLFIEHSFEKCTKPIVNLLNWNVLHHKPAAFQKWSMYNYFHRPLNAVFGGKTQNFKADVLFKFWKLVAELFPAMQ